MEYITVARQYPMLPRYPVALRKGFIYVCVFVLVTQSCSTLCHTRLQPTRLFCPWNSPGKNTGVGCHFLLQGIFPTQGSNLSLCIYIYICYAAANSLQLCLTLWDPVDGSPPGSSVHGILQARILEWTAISFSNAFMLAKSVQSCLTLCDPMDNSPPGFSVHGILQAKYWSGQPFPSPGHLPSPRIESCSASQADSLPSEPLGKPIVQHRSFQLIGLTYGT